MHYKLSLFFSFALANSYFENKNYYPDIKGSMNRVPQINLEHFGSEIKDKFQLLYGVNQKRIQFDLTRKVNYPVGSEKWFNSLIVSPHLSSEEMHGKLGYQLDGQPLYKPKPTPPPLKKTGIERKRELQVGGFYQKLSDALPLSRPPIDKRTKACKLKQFDYSVMPPVSIIITYYNEPFSTLMRTVHSILNNTPPELITEILLIDDNSNYVLGPTFDQSAPENLDYEALIKFYVQHLPKVKLARLPHRRGLVQARLAGIRQATADVVDHPTDTQVYRAFLQKTDAD